MWIYLLTALTLSGRYEGSAPEGRVWLDLRPDGRAELGGARFDWKQEGDRLLLVGAQKTHRLKVEQSSAGLALRGPPFGVLWLRPAPWPSAHQKPSEKPARPSEWLGGWAHVASGGRLTLELRLDGRYMMTQSDGGPGVQTHGRWSAPDGALELTPDGGSPLRYRARRQDRRLLIRGGDLAFEVAFEPTHESQLSPRSPNDQSPTDSPKP